MRFLKNGIGKMRNWGTEKMENWRGEKTKNKNGENLNFVKNATARIVGKSFDFSGKVLKTVFEKNPEKNKKNSKNEEMENRIAELEKKNAELRAKKIAENEEKIEEIKIKIAAAEEFEKMRAEKKARRIELGKEIFDFAAQIFGAVAENFAGKEEIDSEKLLQKFAKNSENLKNFSAAELQFLVQHFFKNFNSVLAKNQQLQKKISKFQKSQFFQKYLLSKKFQKTEN